MMKKQLITLLITLVSLNVLQASDTKQLEEMPQRPWRTAALQQHSSTIKHNADGWYQSLTKPPFVVRNAPKVLSLYQNLISEKNSEELDRFKVSLLQAFSSFFENAEAFEDAQASRATALFGNFLTHEIAYQHNLPAQKAYEVQQTLLMHMLTLLKYGFMRHSVATIQRIHLEVHTAKQELAALTVNQPILHAKTKQLISLTHQALIASGGTKPLITLRRVRNAAVAALALYLTFRAGRAIYRRRKGIEQFLNAPISTTLDTVVTPLVRRAVAAFAGGAARGYFGTK